MKKLPAILLYDGDWLKDTVSGCSLAAQGLWLRMMFVGHNSERYGYLCQNGVAIPPESIARRCGCTPEQYTILLAELDEAGVPSRTPDGIIFSRRMVRDAKERKANREYKRKSRSQPDVRPMSGECQAVSSSSVSSSKKGESIEDDAGNLPPMALAHKVVGELRLRGPGILPAVGEAIEALVAESKGHNEAVEFLIVHGKEALARGETVNRFWFDDSKWRKSRTSPPDEYGGHFEGTVYVTKDGKRMPGYKPPPKAKGAGA